MGNNRDLVEEGLDSIMDATKSVMDGTMDFIGDLIGINNSESDDDDNITVTKNEDGSTTIHISKD